MPRHLISDAHEWINEILTVPIYALANPQQRERALQNRRGKKTLLSLTLVWNEKWIRRCRISGSSDAKLKYHYFELCFSQKMERRGRRVGGNSPPSSSWIKKKWRRESTPLARQWPLRPWGKLLVKAAGGGWKTSKIFSMLGAWFLYLWHFTFALVLCVVRLSSALFFDPCFWQFLMGSLAGAARMWKDSACVQRGTQAGQKPAVD